MVQDLVGDKWSFINGYYLLRGINLRTLFKELDASDTVDVCKAIMLDDAMRDAEVDGGLTKIREQLNLNDGKMYMESNPDSEIDLDPMESGWGMNNSFLPDDGLVGPLE